MVTIVFAERDETELCHLKLGLPTEGLTSTKVGAVWSTDNEQHSHDTFKTLYAMSHSVKLVTAKADV